MKKKVIKLIFIFSLLSGIFISCSKNNEEVVEDTLKQTVNNYVYNYTLSFIGDDNNDYSFMPFSMKNLLNRNVIKEGIFYTYFQLLYPGRINQHNLLNFYDLYGDDGHWVDLMIMELEEQRIASQLLELENNLSQVINPVDEEIEKTEAENKESVIKEYIKNEVMTENKNLGYMEYGEEKLIPQVLGDNYILINSFKENVSRDFYDKFFRCYKSENWKISSDSEELLKTTEVKYKGDSYIPESKIITEKNHKKYQLFNDNGQLIDEKVYSLCENKEYIKSHLTLKYTTDNKIKENNIIEYNYDDDKCSKLLYSFNKKYIYKPHNNDIPSDFDYYENNVLKMKNKYYSDDTYTSRIYFDNDYSVTTYYQNNIIVKEVFSIKDVVERVNVYEQ